MVKNMVKCGYSTKIFVYVTFVHPVPPLFNGVWWAVRLVSADVTATNECKKKWKKGDEDEKK